MSYLIVVLLLIYALAVAHPLTARGVVAELKRRWRLYLIQRKGEAAAAEIIQAFVVQALDQGFQREQIEEVIAKKWPALVVRLGTKETSASLGEPTSLERYY